MKSEEWVDYKTKIEPEIQSVIDDIPDRSVRKPIRRLCALWAGDYYLFLEHAKNATPAVLKGEKNLEQALKKLTSDVWMHNKLGCIFNDIRSVQKPPRREGITEDDLVYTGGFFDHRPA